MNLFSSSCLVSVARGIVFGASVGLFVHGADISIGIGCGIGSYVAVSETFPIFD
jgi:hypothetical protein